MPKYHVDFTGWAGWSTTVEADDEESALDLAYEDAPQLCAQCSGWGRDWYLEISDDWDVADEGVTILDD